MFWDTALLSVSQGERRADWGTPGLRISAGGEIIFSNILTNRLSVTEDQGRQPAQHIIQSINIIRADLYFYFPPLVWPAMLWPGWVKNVGGQTQ